MAPPSTNARQLSYIAFAHCDDVYASWSLIGGATDNYKVFIMCTRGGASGYCNYSSNNVEPGEDVPSPLPAGQGSNQCKEARIHSFENFLSYMGTKDSGVGHPGPGRGTGPLPGTGGYIVSASDRNAVLFCDYPDSGLSTGNVDACIRAARNERGLNIPNLPEQNLIGCWPRGPRRSQRRPRPDQGDLIRLPPLRHGP